VTNNELLCNARLAGWGDIMRLFDIARHGSVMRESKEITGVVGIFMIRTGNGDKQDRNNAVILAVLK